MARFELLHNGALLLPPTPNLQQSRRTPHTATSTLTTLSASPIPPMAPPPMQQATPFLITWTRKACLQSATAIPRASTSSSPQDCSGFNLGSFFVRRSAWTDRLLDIWWDPVFYEQRHMEWEHKEQDALEYIYTNQPWIRPHVAFISQRLVNAFPNGACGGRSRPPGRRMQCVKRRG